MLSVKWVTSRCAAMAPFALAAARARNGENHPSLITSRGLRLLKMTIDWREQRYGSRPKTATPLGVPTKTLPFAIIGVMNLLPAPKWSRPALAWLLL